MKSNLRTAILSIVLLLNISLLAQQGYRGGKGQGANKNLPAIGQISGQIIDANTNEQIEYATIALFHKRTKELSSGTISQRNGKFFLEKLKPGKYEVKISFMGYEQRVIEEVMLRMDEPIVNLHKIKIKPNMQSLEEVVIDGSAPRIDYRIDKKVINVSKQITSVSGSAVDVLENVPSIKVDIEGNVSLRGSTGFTVLIDGRPSVLDANDALQQIPASTIDNIEIITNPSAKYDPDGTAGIINIITKKNKLQGFSGIVNANLGLNTKYGGDFLLNYKKRNLNIFFGADYNVRNHPGNSFNDRSTYISDDLGNITDTIRTVMTGDNARERNMWGFKAGGDYSIGSNDVIGMNFRFGDRKMNGETFSSNQEWRTIDDSYLFYNKIEKSERGGQFYSAALNYQHKFEKKGHELKAEFSSSSHDFKDNSIYESSSEAGVVTDGRMNTETGPSSRLRGKVDYTLPVGEKGKFEAGFQTRFSNSEDLTKMKELNVETGEYETQPEYSNQTTYKRNIHAIYSTFGNEMGNFGYQAGVRGEYTYRDIISKATDEQFGIDRWDFFPTLHLSYQLPKDHQLMASYTRRIQRSRGWYLEPFITWTGPNQVRQGNPDLLPEYIDSYEMGYLKKIGKTNMISLEGYYRETHNKVERVQSVYYDNVMLSTIENVGTDYSLGLEFMFSFQLYKWWEMDLMGDFYKYRVEGVLYEDYFSNNSNNWSSRFNNTFNIRKGTKFQINSMYNGPTVTAQGQREGYYMVNAAVRQDFLDRKLSAVLQVRDIFSTAKREMISSGPDFLSYSEFKRDAPVVTFSISYKFNNYRANRKSRSGGDGGDMEEE